ncbi:MAG: response regulator transcription factor [Saprospiraceae bacterium]|nr:response regulator transcription factor [Saprospiraceae bacterium]
MEKSIVRVCLVEDDDEIRKLTREVIELSPLITCTTEYSSGEAFIRDASTLKTDVVLMDIGLPQITGTECVKHCMMHNYDLNFIMYTTHFDPAEVFEALRVGAKGYILKDSESHKLVEDILEMHHGGSPMSPQISRMVLESFNQYAKTDNNINKLTKQEKEILFDLDLGMNYKEIAASRFISPNTVRTHIRTIYEKLHVHSKLEAIRMLKNK